MAAEVTQRPRVAQPETNTKWTVESDVGMLDVFSRGSTSEQRIDFSAPEDVRTVLRDLGRTEDVKFSPDNRRLAVAGYKKNKLVVFDVAIEVTAAGTRVSIQDFIEITSPGLHAPHGLCFIDDQTLVVANRWGDVPILKLPPCGAEEKNVELIPVQTIGRDRVHLVDSPGSVTVSLFGQNRYELLVCNNYANYVTRHILQNAGHLELQSSEILLSKGLGVPDGVAVSSDRRWIAISNHNAHSVFLYENAPRLSRDSEPDGILRNLNYPHGLLFAPDDSFMLVADAGAPYVNIYARDGDSWAGTRDPVAALRVMDETTYRRGRKNPQEGGPKGIDIDSGMNVLVTTCDEQVLAFFDLPSMLKRRGVSMDWRKKSVQWRVGRVREHLRRMRGWK
jgi:DNA-binding beta-propeller fold protein YncE